MLVAMIARRWTARATTEGAEKYLRFFEGSLVPGLEVIDGHRGAEVFLRDDGKLVEITVLTFWDSMAAVARFAGSDAERAVVEPEARAVLRDFDERVGHLTLRIDTRLGRACGHEARR
jgi:heme-degrading monooxygenase HmoA